MEIKARVLLVEDDSSLAFIIKDNLEEHGYEVFYASDGVAAYNLFMKHNIDICLLDVMLPKKDGMALATQIRKKNDKVPILFLTAKSMDEDRIAGFKAGGDDYITKPFNMEELLLRMNVFLKHTQDNNKEEQTVFQLSNVTFDSKNLVLIDEGKETQLTQKESDLLKYLCLNANTVVKRDDVLMNVWGKDDYFLGRSMDVFMTKIRKYIKNIEGVELQTVHGVGFKMIIDQEEE